MIAQLVSMNSSIDESLQATLFVERSGDRSNSPLGTALSTLMTRDKHTWQVVISVLLAEFKLQKGLRQMGVSSKDTSLTAQ